MKGVLTVLVGEKQSTIMCVVVVVVVIVVVIIDRITITNRNNEL